MYVSVGFLAWVFCFIDLQIFNLFLNINSLFVIQVIIAKQKFHLICKQFSLPLMADYHLIHVIHTSRYVLFLQNRNMIRSTCLHKFQVSPPGLLCMPTVTKMQHIHTDILTELCMYEFSSRKPLMTILKYLGQVAHNTLSFLLKYDTSFFHFSPFTENPQSIMQPAPANIRMDFKQTQEE